MSFFNGFCLLQLKAILIHGYKYSEYSKKLYWFTEVTVVCTPRVHSLTGHGEWPGFTVPRMNYYRGGL